MDSNYIALITGIVMVITMVVISVATIEFMLNRSIADIIMALKIWNMFSYLRRLMYERWIQLGIGILSCFSIAALVATIAAGRTGLVCFAFVFLSIGLNRDQFHIWREVKRGRTYSKLIDGYLAEYASDMDHTIA